ncbi:EAL domain-containing protein [Pseudoalteromonas umbrosa]|uniref:EAL domain-containing protein n=1 Tax=Pseudoalteromonas umbrosa TaxID=3048489 RepID=UPI0024C35C56|nr:EAL domain-containing protein [Pseudoalteromonas sp. B95]MDK1285738.1 EAL domain-containing protein [Pseudoalteromonas sp. B95]
MDKDIQLVRMPILSTANNEIIGFEVLLRMFHGIPVTIFNLHPELYAELSFELLKAIFTKDKLGLIRNSEQLLFINFTIPQLLSEGTLRFLISLDEKETILNNVVIEITEHELLNQSQEVIERILLLKKFNCRFAVDDFGNKNSNFYNVFELKPDYIKLDGNMVHRYSMEKEPAPLAKLIQLCHELNIEVIAEGIENKEMYDTLSNISSDYLQGYYFGLPEQIR